MNIVPNDSDSSVAKTPSKGSFREIKENVSAKLDTTPKKIGAIVGGTAVVGAITLASLPILALATVGSIVGGTVGIGISGVYLTYKGTKKAAEGLADSQKFQKAMGALSISKLIKKVVLNPIDRSATKAAFKKPIQDANKINKAAKNLEKAVNKYRKEHNSELGERDIIKENSIINPLKKMATDINGISYEALFNNVKAKYLSDSEYKGAEKILDKLSNFYTAKDGTKTFEECLEIFQSEHPNQTSKLFMILKLVKAREDAEEKLKTIKDKASKNAHAEETKKTTKTEAPKAKATPSMSKEFYKAIIKPIEHLYTKGKVRGSLNIDVKTLSFDDCEKIAKVAKKLEYEVIQ